MGKAWPPLYLWWWEPEAAAIDTVVDWERGPEPGVTPQRTSPYYLLLPNQLYLPQNSTTNLGTSSRNISLGIAVQIHPRTFTMQTSVEYQAIGSHGQRKGSIQGHENQEEDINRQWP